MQASTDMATWTTLTTVTMGSTGCATYVDKFAYKHNHQFYRIVPVP